MFFEWCVMMPFRPRHLGGYVLRHRSQDAAAASTARRLRSGLRVLRALPRPAADCAAGLTQLAALLTASDTSADVHATP